jgi:hypothetical protein
VIVIDDVDGFDPLSLGALTELFSAPPLPILLTCEHPPDGLHDRLLQRPLSLPTGAEIAPLVPASWPALRDLSQPIEPLFAAQLAGWGEAEPPATLLRLVERRLAELSPAQRRSLQALSVLGESSPETLRSVVIDPRDLDEGLPSLCDGGLVSVYSGLLRVEHRVVAQISIATTPAGALSELNSRAALATAGTVERHAYHTARTTPDLSTYVAAENVATLRERRGDLRGTALALAQGVEIARREVLSGDNEVALSAWMALGRKLGFVLARQGEFASALAVFEEVLERTRPQGVDKARLMTLAATAAAGVHRDEDPALWSLLARSILPDDLPPRPRSILFPA